MKSKRDIVQKKKKDNGVTALVKRAIQARQYRSDWSLENSEVIFSAASRLANTLSSMPLRLCKNGTPVKNEMSYVFGVSPNPNMTSCEFFRALEMCRDTNGNAYALIAYNELMQIIRADILEPERVTPLWEPTVGEVWYRVNFDSGERYFHNAYVLHMKFPSANGLVGISPIRVLYDTLGYADKVAKYSLDMFDKGMNAAIALEAPSQLSTDRRKAVVASFQEVYKETGGAVLLLESGITAKALSLSPVDAKLFEVERITRSKAATIYNIPPHLMGDYSDTSFNSMEQEALEFLQFTMLPIITHYEQQLDKKTLTESMIKDGYSWQFDAAAVLRADAATRADVNVKAIRAGWKTPDEARREDGYEPFKNDVGAHPMVARDLIPLDTLVNHPEWLLKVKEGNQ